MRGAIVDLDRSAPPTRRRSADRLAIAALTLGCVVFGVVVAMARPAAAPTAAPVFDAMLPTGPLVRGVVLHPLLLPPTIVNVDLSAMPDRLANEAAPSSWRRVITVRGVPGVAAIEGPAVVAWTENGIAYWLASPTRSTEELIAIADELR